METARAWLNEQYPAFAQKRGSMIDSLPDLRLFHSPEAKASLKPWTRDMAWERLVEDLDSCLQSPEETDRVILDLLLKLMEEKEKSIQDELADYHTKDLYAWCSAYPILSYVLLNEEALYAFAVAADHPNLRTMLEKPKRRTSQYFLAAIYDNKTRRPSILYNSKSRWNGPSLALFSTNQETSDWLVDKVVLTDDCFSIAETWENPYFIMSLWKKHGPSDRLFTIACRSNAIDVVLAALRGRVCKDGDTNYLAVTTAFWYMSDVTSLSRILEEIKDTSRLGYAAWDAILSHLNMSSASDWLAQILPLIHSYFPHDQYGDELLGWQEVVDALSRNNQPLIDFYLENEIGVHDEPGTDPLSYCIHGGLFSTLSYLLPKYHYDPYSLLLDVANNVYEHVDETTLNLILERHQYTKEQLTAALSYASENKEKTQLLLKKLGLVKQTPARVEYKRYELKKE